jgi:hypothetical protein
VPVQVQRPVQIINYVDRPVAYQVERAIGVIEVPVYLGAKETGQLATGIELPAGGSYQTAAYTGATVYPENWQAGFETYFAQNGQFGWGLQGGMQAGWTINAQGQIVNAQGQVVQQQAGTQFFQGGLQAGSAGWTVNAQGQIVDAQGNVVQQAQQFVQQPTQFVQGANQFAGWTVDANGQLVQNAAQLPAGFNFNGVFPTATAAPAAGRR